MFRMLQPVLIVLMKVPSFDDVTTNFLVLMKVSAFMEFLNRVCQKVNLHYASELQMTRSCNVLYVQRKMKIL